MTEPNARERSLAIKLAEKYPSLAALRDVIAQALHEYGQEVLDAYKRVQGKRGGV